MILDSQIYSLRWESHPSVNEKLSISQSFYFVLLTVWLQKVNNEPLTTDIILDNNYDHLAIIQYQNYKS